MVKRSGNKFGGQNVVLVAKSDVLIVKTLIKDNYFLDIINMSEDIQLK